MLTLLSFSEASSSLRLPVAVTLQPRRAYCTHNSLPMPEVAPMISTLRIGLFILDIKYFIMKAFGLL
jgi:hypothetical protein